MPDRVLGAPWDPAGFNQKMILNAKATLNSFLYGPLLSRPMGLCNDLNADPKQP